MMLLQNLLRSALRRWGLQVLSCGFFLFGAMLSYGQASPANPNPTPLITPAPPPIYPNSKAPDYGPGSPRTLTFEDMQYRRYIEFRLKTMNTDAAKLLKLARELNEKIVKSGVRSLSDEDLHKLAQIEKLAKEVKSKMELATSARPQ